MSASRLHPMLQEFRRIFVQEANTRFHLKGTPNEHVLLCLKMNPLVDLAHDGPFGKRATRELMEAVYMTRLRARQQQLLSATLSAAQAPSLAPAPAPPSSAPAPAQAGSASGSANEARQKEAEEIVRHRSDSQSLAPLYANAPPHRTPQFGRVSDTTEFVATVERK